MLSAKRTTEVENGVIEADRDGREVRERFHEDGPVLK